jgi:autotransporter translocation and assembly factor TamB
LLDPTNPAPARPVDGSLNGTVKLAGNQKDIDLDAHLESRLTAARDTQGVDIAVDASYDASAFKLTVDAGDRQGKLLHMAANAGLDVERLLAHPTPGPELMDTLRWDLSAELSKRSLSQLPMLRSMEIGADLAQAHASLKASLSHESRAQPVGTLDAQLQWDPGTVLRPAATSCSDRVRGELQISGRWADEKAGVELQGETQGKEAVRAALRARLPWNDLVAGKPNAITGVQVAAQLHELDLQSLPWLCEQGAGRVSLTAKATDVLTSKADMAVQLETKGLRWQGSPPLGVQVEVRSEPKSVQVAAQVSSGASGKLNMRGRLPVDIHATGTNPMVRRDDPAQLDLFLDKVPMASLLAFAPGVARVSGTTTGSIKLTGSIANPDVRGTLALEDVSLTLPRMGQRFSHVHLKAQLDGRTLRLSEGKIRDLDGSASIAALLNLQALDAWNAEVNVHARNFPMRNSGVMMGRADADAKVVARSTPQRTGVDVSLSNVAIELTSDGFGDVQSLDPNPDFSFTDARVDRPKNPEASDDKPSTPAPPTVIQVKTADPLWVRRDDFAVQMEADLSVTLGGKTPLLEGKIDLLRGYISLLGQSFDIKRGQVVLAGGEKVDPQLEITAEHDTPGGKRVRVEVRGFVAAPELAFYVDDQTVTAGDAIIAITGSNGRGGSASPEDQIASAAIGMTTGLLTLGARREFGDWIPMLAINQGQVRVGIEADRFIPKFLKGFVRGAYVEGIVSSSDSSSSSSGGSGNVNAGGSTMANGGSGSGTSSGGSATSGNGVLLELTLPKNFVWAGQYGPGQAWSIDLDWRP